MFTHIHTISIFCCKRKYNTTDCASYKEDRFILAHRSGPSQGPISWRPSFQQSSKAAEGKMDSLHIWVYICFPSFSCLPLSSPFLSSSLTLFSMKTPVFIPGSPSRWPCLILTCFLRPQLYITSADQVSIFSMPHSMDQLWPRISEKTHHSTNNTGFWLRSQRAEMKIAPSTYSHISKALDCPDKGTSNILRESLSHTTIQLHGCMSQPPTFGGTMLRCIPQNFSEVPKGLNSTGPQQ